MSALLAMFAFGCGGHPPVPEPPDLQLVCDDAATWTTVGEPYVRTWCTGCHSSTLPLELRYGAPAGLDFDTLDGVRAYAGAVASAVDAERMPPAGGPLGPAANRFVRWIRCGAPGTDAPPAATCDGAAEIGGDVAIGSAGDAAALCAGGPAVVAGGLSVATDAALDCVCGVGGDVTVTGGAVSLGAVEEVGGALTIASDAVSVELPSLRSVGAGVSVAGGVAGIDVGALEEVGGSVRVEAAPALAGVLLERLRTVGGDVVIHDVPAATAVDLSRLVTVPGDLRVEDAGMVVLLGQAYALETVGGDLVLAGVPAWQGFYGFANLASVGGDLRIEGAGIERVRGFTLLATVGGSLTVRGNPTLGLLDGFDSLLRVDGDLVIADNPAMFAEDAFAQLDEVVGTLTLTDLPALGTVQGVVRPRTLGGLWIERVGLPAVVYPGLVSVGDVRLIGLDGVDQVTWPSLAAISGSYEVRDLAVTSLGAPGAVDGIGGDLIVADNLALDDVAGLAAVGSVGGDLVVTDNPALATADAEALAGALAVEGAVTIDGNGP